MDKKTYYTFLIMGSVIIVMLGILIIVTSKSDHNYFNLNHKLVEGNNSNKVEPKKEEKDIKKDINDNKDNDIKDDTPINKDNNITYTEKDNIVISNLNNTIKDIDASDKKDFESKGKATFINIVDFLFYDGSINGVTFKELSDKGKEKVLELASTIDTKIEDKAPGYKDSINKNTKKAYNKASELIKKGSTNLNEFLQNHLDEDDYNSIIDAKNELVEYTKNAASFVKDVSSSLFTNTKDKLSKWYQEYKNK